MSNLPDNHNFYDAETILKYLSGQMSREEIRVFERAMLDDEMLAEAVQGYEWLQQKETDQEILRRTPFLSKTESKLHNPNNNQLVARRVIRKFSYGIAAVCLLGVGWWLFSISRPETVLPVENTGIEKKILPAPAFDSLPPTELVTTLNTPVPATKSETKMPAESKKKFVKKNSTLINNKPLSKTSEKIEENGISPSHSNQAMEIETDRMPQKRMLLAPAKARMAHRIHWNPDDSIRVSPAEGWPSYLTYLMEINMPFSLQENGGRATLTIDNTGKITTVKIEGTLTEVEKATIESRIKKGPIWINHTGKTQQTTIEWQ